MMLLLGLACIIDGDGDGHPLGSDCDDAQASIWPGAIEVCDGVDQDCDGLVDEGVSHWLYLDEDGDGHGGEGLWSCDTGGLVKVGGDCDDSNPAIHPGAVEADCDDPVDYNCDGSTRYTDADGDGVPACLDCDDGDLLVFPGAEESCNGLDDDCDGLTDYGAPGAQVWYPDADGDGYGVGVGVVACDDPGDHAPQGGDCDDQDEAVHPAREELCDGVDQDCDGVVDDEAIDATLAWLDADGDGFGAGEGELLCEVPEQWSVFDGDCDDSDTQAFPGNTEVCDRIDNDCDGDVDFDAWVPDDHSTIRQALTAASTGDHICVDAGTYLENLSFTGLTVTLEGVEGAVIDGDGNRTVVFESGSQATLRGFTIQGGAGSSGAAIWVDECDPTLEDLVIEGNLCASQTCRGVVHLEDSKGTLSNLLIRDNTGGAAGSTVYGVGLSIQDGAPALDGVRILDNQAQGSSIWAVGLYASSAGGDWEHLDIRGNQASSSSFATTAGLSLNNGTDPTVSNFIVAGNSVTASTIYSVGVWCYSGCTAELVNGVIASNEAVGGFVYGVGLTSYSGSSPSLTNVVVSSNSGSGDVSGAGITAVSASTVGVAYGDVYGNGTDWYGLSDPTGQDGNLSVSPGFVYSAGSIHTKWDFALTSSSSLVDAGDPNLLDSDGSSSDIGAYGGPGGDWL